MISPPGHSSTRVVRISDGQYLAHCQCPWGEVAFLVPTKRSTGWHELVRALGDAIRRRNWVGVRFDASGDVHIVNAKDGSLANLADHLSWGPLQRVIEKREDDACQMVGLTFNDDLDHVALFDTLAIDIGAACKTRGVDYGYRVAAFTVVDMADVRELYR